MLGEDIANSHQFGTVHGNVHIGNQNASWIIAVIAVVIPLMMAGYYVKTRTTATVSGGAGQAGGAGGSGTATNVPKTLPATRIPEPKHNDKPKHVKQANPGATAKATPPLAVPAPAVVPPPATTAGTQSLSPYDELKNAEEQVRELDRGYVMEVNTAMSQFAGPYKQRGEMPKTYPESMVQGLNNIDNQETYFYKFDVQPMVQTAHDHAIERMNLTPNQKEADAELFKEANKQALTPTPIVDLQNERPNREQFDGLVQYLDDLLRKLGDYK